MMNLFILLFMDNCIVSSLRQIKLQWAFLTIKFDTHMHAFMLGMSLGVELFSNKLNLCIVIHNTEATTNLNLSKPALMGNACQGNLTYTNHSPPTQR